MFQSVRDAKTRRELGEHYTSEVNILRTLNPLFLDELWTEFEHVKTLGKYEADRLRKLRDRLGQIRYMDPACGCGNFIIVAYRELRDLELLIMERLQEITGAPTKLIANYGLKVTLDHFYGIEIDEWPARIAETAMFLIDRQCDLRLTASLGWAPDRLPIEKQATIIVANALQTDWSHVVDPAEGDVIIAGNPPFIGISERSSGQTADLQRAWGDDYHGSLDYVTAWYRLAARYVTNDRNAFAFVSTNSIVQGEQVAVFWRPIRDAGFSIAFAHQTFAWSSEATGGAQVHVVILGIRQSSGVPAQRRLFVYENVNADPAEIRTSALNAYLVPGPDELVASRSAPLASALPPVRYGNKPTDGGNFIVSVDSIDQFRSDPIASRYLRRFPGAKELLHNLDRWCLWLVDAPPEDVLNSPMLSERVRGVRDFREASKAESTREAANTPHAISPDSTARWSVPLYPTPCERAPTVLSSVVVRARCGG
jgi:hypothetical protein